MFFYVYCTNISYNSIKNNFRVRIVTGLVIKKNKVNRLLTLIINNYYIETLIINIIIWNIIIWKLLKQYFLILILTVLSTKNLQLLIHYFPLNCCKQTFFVSAVHFVSLSCTNMIF